MTEQPAHLEERVVRALAELVYLHDVLKITDPPSYEKRKPDAWTEARHAIHQWTEHDGRFLDV